MRRLSAVGGLLLAALALPPAARAAGPAAAPDYPPWLPRYDLGIHLDVANRKASVRQRVTWTNRHARPTQEMVFNVYPHYHVPDEDVGLIAKTVEIMRLRPNHAIDWPGKRGVVHKVTLRTKPDAPALDLPFDWRADTNVSLAVTLPYAVAQGQSVTVELEYTLTIPGKQGRWGQWPVNADGSVCADTVTQLSAWLPVLAYHDECGWQPMPFVPWHQPWFNEAGVYSATIVYPAGQKIGCGCAIASDRDRGDGWREATTAAQPLRDFALMSCAAYCAHDRTVKLASGKEVLVRCLALPRHAFYGEHVARIASEAVQTYSQWFGDYPYPQLTLCESFFGWNGNECSGLIMIDSRVMGMPHLGVGYVEYLVSHETCHQWWYNVVGNNGYRETFMDEAFATYCTHRWLDRKLGKNNQMLQWPEGLDWLPNICRENYRYSQYFGTVRRGESAPAVADLPTYGHIINLFSAAYDRGSKILGMIEDRLGEAAFLDFLRLIQRKYRFQVMFVKDLQRELEAYTGQNWQTFFDRWVYGAGLTDWSMGHAEVTQTQGPTKVVVRVKQRGDFAESTTLGVRFDDGEHFPVRIPIVPGQPTLTLDQPPATVIQEDATTYRVEMTLPAAPTQMSVDPDRVLIDREPDNNDWKSHPRVKFSPFMNMLDEATLTNDYDKWNLIYGPWFSGGTVMNNDPWYTRPTLVGARASAIRTDQFVGGVYGAYRTDFNDIVVGVDGLVDHWPGGTEQVGFHAERRVAGPIGTETPNDVTRASVFARHVFNYNSSLYLPPIHYAEAFLNYQDNPLPTARTWTPGAERADRWATGGVHYRINYLTPYWNPEGGFQFDATYAGGAANFGEWEAAHLLQAQYAQVKRLPEEWGGYWSRAVLAGRVGGAVAFPDRGEFFALGGSQVFRGYDLAQRQGSAYWVASAEIRLPIALDVEWDILDHTAGGRDLYAVAFYDVGDIYADGRSVGGRVAHAFGAGLRLDAAIFSFIERCTLRLDVGKTVNDGTPWQVWFGVQQAF